MASVRHILASFERWQRERAVFVAAVCDFARQAENVQALVASGALPHLRALVTDPVPCVGHVAALALGRLASHSQAAAEELVRGGLHTVLASQLGSAFPSGGLDAKLELAGRRAAVLCLKGLARHCPQQVAGGGGAAAAVACLCTPDTDLQEAGAAVLGSVGGHSPELAGQVAAAGALPPLVACLASPDLAVQRAAGSALSDVAKHGPALAQQIVDAGALGPLTDCLKTSDAKLRRRACCTLGHLAGASPELAAAVIGGGVLPEIVRCLGTDSSADPALRRHAAVALLEMAKLGEGSAQALADCSSCLPALVAAAAPGDQMLLPAVMALGILAAYTKELASRAIEAGAVHVLSTILQEGTQQDHVSSAAVWALGQLGRHSAANAKSVADAGIIAAIASMGTGESSSEDLKAKANKALAGILAQLRDLSSLGQLVQRALPVAHMCTVMGQLAVAIAAEPARRFEVVQCGALKAVEELGEAEGSPFKEYMQRITEQFPEEIVRYYSPTFKQRLLSQLAPASNPELQTTAATQAVESSTAEESSVPAENSTSNLLAESSLPEQ